MVKQAADEHSPLLTAEQRVDKAMADVMKGNEFSDEQLEWLQRLRTHLVENLSVDDEDFNVVPLFSRPGGLGGAKGLRDAARAVAGRAE
jgi:type I restriction enzyme, R subunit